MKNITAVMSIVMLCMSLFVKCSMPSDAPAPSWRNAIDIPLANLRFELAELLDNDKIIDPDSSSVGDTMTLRIDQRDSATIERQIVNLQKNTLEQKIGSIEIRNSDDVDVGFNLPYTSVVPVPADVPLDQTKPAKVKRVYRVIIDSSSPDIEVHIYNNFRELPVSDIQFRIIDNGMIIGSGTVPYINPMDSATVMTSLAGKQLDSLIDISLTATIKGGVGRNSQPDDSIGLRFNLDGQKIAAAEISDSLLNLSKRYTKQLELSDTLEVSYIDFDTTEFSFSFSSPAELRLNLVAELLNLWDISFAEQRGIQSENTIGIISASDSLRYYQGVIFDDTIVVQSANAGQTGKIRFNSSRLLCRWDNVTQRSVGDYVYRTAIIPRGARVSFNKNDVFRFEMTPLRFPFVALRGTLRQPLSDTIDGKSITLNLPIDAGTLLEKVRGKLLFSNFTASVALKIMLPGNSWVDSARMKIAVGIPDAPSNRTVGEALFRGRSDTLSDSLILNLTSILNQFPDSLRVEGNFGIPAGTQLLIHNKRDASGNYSNLLSLHAAVVLKADLPLVWSVSDSIAALLDNSTFEVPEDLSFLGKTGDACVKVNVDVLNQTNLQAVLYAIGAPKEYKNELFSLSEDDIGPSVLRTASGKHFFQLFGDRGIVLPGRGQKFQDQIGMEAEDTKKFFSSDTCYIRWRLTLHKKSADALHDTDYVSIRSSIHVSGTVNADSLWGL